MARMHPPQPDGDVPASERKVFERLRQLPDPWLVIHARRFLLPANAGREPAEGEVDFLVLDPDRGYIGLEVKGGGVRRDGAVWYSTDRHGQDHRIKDPGRQAQNAVHAIDRYLSQQASFRALRTRIRFGWGVVLPDVDVTESLGPDLPRDVVIDRGDLRSPTSALNHVFRSHALTGPPVMLEAQKAFMAALAPHFRLLPSLAARIDDDEPILVRLTDEQMEILDTLTHFPRVAVQGGAGTGKTLVAMEKARRLRQAGLRVLYLCYNRPLADFLAARASDFSVKSFHDLCHDLAKSAGVPFKPAQAPDAEQRFWEEQAPELLMQALDIYPDERWDAVIVDEGQDFRELWWLVVEKLLRDPKEGTLWVFFDPAQNIYVGGPTEALGLTPVPLRWNCRNTGRIAAHFSQYVTGKAELKPGTPDGEDVRVIGCADDKAMCDAVRSTLHRLVIEEKIATDKIVVLSARGDRASAVWRARKLGNLTLVELGQKPGPNEVRFASLQRFKGLESEIVILCDVEPGSPLSSPAHLYVGASRARHVLVVARYLPK